MPKGVHKAKPAFRQLSFFPEPEPVPLPSVVHNNDLTLDGRSYEKKDGAYREKIGKNSYEVVNTVIIDRLEKLWREQNLIGKI